MSFKQNLLDATDAIGTAISKIDAADGGDKTGVPQAAQDAVDRIATANENDNALNTVAPDCPTAGGTLTALKNQLTQLANSIPDAPDPLAGANQTMQS